MGTDAANRGVPFNWDLLVVENVGHPAKLMAHATAGAVFAGATTPADVALSPIDDTYIDESNPSDVFGASLDLRVDGGNQEMAFLKFDLSSVSAAVDVAMLKLYITNGSDGQQFVHAVDNNTWTESSLTWNNAPALGQEIGMTTGGEKEGILYVEVTDYINEKIGGLASLAFQSEDTDQLYFSSSEASYFPAQLVLFTGNSKEGQDPPKTISLLQVIPNPVQHQTMIFFTLPASHFTSLKVFDVTGRLVRILMEEQKKAGTYSVLWDGKETTGRRVSSGIYFYRLTAHDFAASRKLVFLR
jgi:hypothetical protein